MIRTLRTLKAPGVSFTVIKILLVLVYLACDYQAVAERIAVLWPTAMLLFYFGLYAFLAVALVAVAFIPGIFVRVVVACILASASVALHSYEWSTASPLDYKSFETMLASAGDAGDAAAQHGVMLIKAIAVALVLFAAIALPPRGDGLPLRLHWLMPVAALLVLTGLLYVRGGEGSRALPAAYPPLAHASIKGALLLTERGGPRKAVEFAPPSQPPDHDIVVIVDESIAPRYLDINGAAGVHSGLAQKRPGLSLINYGIAAAVTNCSAGSNRTLRFGGTRENYRLTGQVYPSIWAYARTAGLRTVYLDGQRNGGTLQNLMTPDERAEIDDFVQLDGVPVIARDHRLADLIAERLANGVPEFIYVNKVGGHFPVADKFPDEAARFLPIPERGKTGSITDMGPIHGDHQGTQDEWRLYRNAYRNTLIWNVGGFFDRLLPRINPASAPVIIYTADHGQDLHEGGHPGKATHCIGNPLPEEGAVPLVVIDRVQAPRLDWSEHLAANHNGMSHFRIFPTLLRIMGFADEETAALYGPSLASPEPDAMTFTNDYFASLGREPTWRRIEPEALAMPPRSDHAQLAGH